MSLTFSVITGLKSELSESLEILIDSDSDGDSETIGLFLS